jgi:hypothetical protein
MTSKKFVDLVYVSMIHDDFNLYDAVLAVKEHYNINDQQFLEIIKSEKTLKDDLMCCCQSLGLVKNPNESKPIGDLF